MELAKGRTVDAHIRHSEGSEGAFRVDRERLFIALQIADAIQYLHQHRMVHRDVKPANVFIAGWTRKNGLPIVKLGDFGVVKWGEFHASIATGTITVTSQKGLGTMKYMSPEQAIKPKEVTPKSDMYSLGITLFEIFTGQILASSHHAYELTLARLERGTTVGRYHRIGYSVAHEDERIGEMILDMSLRGASGRPSIDKVLGRLSSRYTNEFDQPSQSEFAD